MAERSGKSKAAPPNFSDQAQKLLTALAERGIAAATDRVGSLTDRLSDYAENGGPGLRAALKGGKEAAQGASPLKAALSAGGSAVKDKIGSALGGGGGGGGGGKKQKVTNIVEQIDVGVPVRLAYNQWTQFQDFPEITKKVEGAEQQDEQKLHWKAQILWSHREWESTIVEQVPDRRIVWRSSGQKGHVDGAVTFHEIAPELTRILLVLEYHPQGLFERTGNLWRAQGRRVRLELKHFRRHVMTQAVLNPDGVEGWRGEIHDSEVTKSHDEALRDEEADTEEEAEEEGAYDDEATEEQDDEYADEDTESEDEYRDEGDYEDDYDEEPEDEPDEDEPETPPRKRRARGGSRRR